jgi:NAD(P)-dependent dehydrogenase (short-subunit alcohol dehydrogenase family)
MLRHEGRAAVVTGAAQGIGRAICARLLADGARVVAVDVNPQTLAATAADLGSSCVAVVADVSREEECARAVEVCVSRFGGIDILAAHAGIAESRPFLAIDAEHWHRHLAVNLDGALFCAVHAARAMCERGRGGAIVYTASINGFHVEQTMTAYNVSKGALLNLVRSTAMDLGRHGIRANGVAPGVVDTPIAAFVVHSPELAPGYLKTMPLGRFGRPEDVASAVSWLASDEASYITGQTLVIDGGQSLGITGDLDTGAQPESGAAPAAPAAPAGSTGSVGSAGAAGPAGAAGSAGPAGSAPGGGPAR